MRKKLPWGLLLIAAVAGIDLVSKVLAHWLLPPERAVVVWKGIFAWYLILNETGVSSVLQKHTSPIYRNGFWATVIAVILSIVLYRKLNPALPARRKFYLFLLILKIKFVVNIKKKFNNFLTVMIVNIFLLNLLCI